MKYRVHALAVIRVPVEIEAASQAEAAQKAADMIFQAERLDGEFAGEITSLLVDEEGDADYEKSQWWTLYAGKAVPDVEITWANGICGP